MSGSSLAKGGRKARSLTAGAVDSLRGQSWPLVPDFFVTVPNLAAAQFPGGATGLFVFTAVRPCTFVGMQEIHTTAGSGGQTIRAKKVLAAATSGPGTAADANNVDISATVDISLSANVRRDIAPIVTNAVNKLAAGDKVALASATGATSYAGALFVLQFVWD